MGFFNRSRGKRKIILHNKAVLGKIKGENAVIGENCEDNVSNLKII
jgi:hypothetical protein